eukprot:403361650
MHQDQSLKFNSNNQTYYFDKYRENGETSFVNLGPSNNYLKNLNQEQSQSASAILNFQISTNFTYQDFSEENCERPVNFQNYTLTHLGGQYLQLSCQTNNFTHENQQILINTLQNNYTSQKQLYKYFEENSSYQDALDPLKQQEISLSQSILINIENSYLDFIQDINVKSRYRTMANVIGFNLRQGTKSLKVLFNNSEAAQLISNQQYQNESVSQSQQDRGSIYSNIFKKNDFSNFKRSDLQKNKEQLIAVLEQYCIQQFDATQFEVVKLIGSGSTASVYLVNDLTYSRSTKQLALKQIYKNRTVSKYQQQIQREVQINRLIQKSNYSVNMHKVFEDEDCVYLLLDYMRGGTLKKYIQQNGHLDEFQSRLFAKQILQGLKDIQSQNIIHKDLKPENILLSSKTRVNYRPSLLLSTKQQDCDDQTSGSLQVKIADFGLAVQSVKDLNGQMKSGTPGFLAPEVLASGHYSKKTDVFSLGCIIYQMVTGSHLFEGESFQEVLKLNKYCLNVQANIELLNKKVFSCSFRNFLSELLAENPQQRLSVDDALNHPWILNKNHLQVKKGKNSNRDIVNQRLTRITLILDKQISRQSQNQNQEQIINPFAKLKQLKMDPISQRKLNQSLLNSDFQKFNCTMKMQTKIHVTAPLLMNYNL